MTMSKTRTTNAKETASDEDKTRVKAPLGRSTKHSTLETGAMRDRANTQGGDSGRRQAYHQGHHPPAPRATAPHGLHAIPQLD